MIALLVDQSLLYEVRRSIGNENAPHARCRIARGRGDHDIPWILEQQFEVTELLDGDAGDMCSYFAPAPALDFAAFDRAQKLSVKAVVAALHAVVRSRWLHVAEQFFAEVPFE